MQVLYKLSKYYLDIIDHLVNTELEVNFLDKIFKKYNVKTILDVACGVGRHTIGLTKKNYQVVGIDFSPSQIKQARKNSKKTNTRVKFFIKNANSFTFPTRFDAAICMWSTLGEEPMQYRKVIKNVFANLKKGGIFVIDNRSWEYIPKNKAETITNVIKNKDNTIKTKIFDRYTENFRVRDVTHNINGKEYRDLCITNILKEKDWINALKEGGFNKFKVYYDRSFHKVKKPKYVTIIAIM
jgi:Methylase involved in ubiquinone/menaquinone biosynthesis